MMDDAPTHLNTNLTKHLFFENWMAETEVWGFFVSKSLITATDSSPLHHFAPASSCLQPKVRV